MSNANALPRLNYAQQSPDLVKRLVDMGSAIGASGHIDKTLSLLVDIRASQMNGCAFCLDMHVKQAKIQGERELRVHHVAIWRESPLFSPRERAALAWTEALTRIPEHGVPDELYENVRKEFSEKEISDLTFEIMAINGWNRANAAFRNVPGAMDKAYGLDKAGLA